MLKQKFYDKNFRLEMFLWAHTKQFGHLPQNISTKSTKIFVFCLISDIDKTNKFLWIVFFHWTVFLYMWIAISTVSLKKKQRNVNFFRLMSENDQQIEKKMLLL